MKTYIIITTLVVALIVSIALGMWTVPVEEETTSPAPAKPIILQGDLPFQNAMTGTELQDLPADTTFTVER